MTTEHEQKTPAQPTNRRYSSVTDLMKGEEVTQEVQQKVAELKSETSVTEQLAALRQCACITQAQMAKHLGVSQGTISKIESGRDEDLTLAVIRAYSQYTGQRVGLVFGKPMTHVEAVKNYAFGIKHHLTALAGLANLDEELEREISGFFGEAFFNLLTILSRCNGQMPHGQEFEIRFQPLEQSPKLRNVPCRKNSALQAAQLVTA
jgi:transcriptional regulator with XRE-family HTH domain